MNTAVRELSVFFPAYFDENNIDRLVPTAVDVLESLELDDYEILIIEDGSPDNTAQVADELAKRFEKVRVIHHEKNLGYGATLKDGFNSAKFDWVFYTDGDCQFDIRELRKFVPLTQTSDLVIGFREHKQYSWFRKLTSRVYNRLVRALFGLRVIDINCAFKLLPKSLFNSMTIASSQGFIDAEILIHAYRMGLSVTQVSVTHYQRTEGVAAAARPSVIIETWLETMKFWLAQKSTFSVTNPGARKLVTPVKLATRLYASTKTEGEQKSQQQMEQELDRESVSG